MAEYIEREAAISWFMPYVHIGGYISADDMVEDIRNLPAADVAPVVRCKDCRWLYDQADDYCCVNHKVLMKITPDSYCSYGEREEG